MPYLLINFLRSDDYEALLRNPSLLIARIAGTTVDDYPWVVIDEVQRIPALLDVVHDQIEQRGCRFALTGSSARKLKRGAANLSWPGGLLFATCIR